MDKPSDEEMIDWLESHISRGELRRSETFFSTIYDVPTLEDPSAQRTIFFIGAGVYKCAGRTLRDAIASAMEERWGYFDPNLLK